MAVTSIVTEFASRMHALADAVRAKAHTSGSMTISQMTSTILTMDAGEDFQAVIEGQRIVSLYNRASVVRPEAFMRYYSLEAVDMPYALSVGYSAFAQCSDLTSVNLPLAEYVGSSAFNGCQSLVEIDLPAMTHMYQYAFAGCVNLESASIPNSVDVPSYAFQNCYELHDVSAQSASIVYNYAFQNCSELTDVSLPMVSQVQSSAFTGCQRLSEISLQNLSSVYNYAFQNCYRLMALHLEGVKSVPYNQGVANVFSNTPLYNQSTYTGGYGSIYVPSSLFAAFKTSWAGVSSRFVSMDAVADGSVAAFGSAPELVSPSYCTLASSSLDGNTATLEVERSAISSNQYSGFNVEIGNLEAGEQYIVDFDVQFAEGTTFQTSYRLGYTLDPYIGSNYASYTAWPDNISRTTDAQSLSRPFYATSDKAYLSFNLSALSTSATSLTVSVSVLKAHWEESA